MENRRSFIKKSGLFMAATSLPLSACVNQPDTKGTEQQIKKNVNVILIVDTANIDKFDKNNLGNYCRFTDQRQGTPIEDFTIYPKKGDTVTWIGLSGSSPDHKVHIKEIKKISGSDVFGKDLKGSGDPEKVIGEVLYVTQNATLDNEPVKKDYKYRIQFRVNNDGQVYNIDPKIQVNQ